MRERRPVVIAGAGPTGLMCALALTRQGIPVVLFEAEPALTHDLRAGSFHPPTLDMMAPYAASPNGCSRPASRCATGKSATSRAI